MAVRPLRTPPGVREAAITLSAASLSQGITTVRTVAAPPSVLQGTSESVIQDRDGRHHRYSRPTRVYAS